MKTYMIFSTMKTCWKAYLAEIEFVEKDYLPRLFCNYKVFHKTTPDWYLPDNYQKSNGGISSHERAHIENIECVYYRLKRVFSLLGSGGTRTDDALAITIGNRVRKSLSKEDNELFNAAVNPSNIYVMPKQYINGNSVFTANDDIEAENIFRTRMKSFALNIENKRLDLRDMLDYNDTFEPLSIIQINGFIFDNDKNAKSNYSKNIEWYQTLSYNYFATTDLDTETWEATKIEPSKLAELTENDFFMFNSAMEALRSTYYLYGTTTADPISKLLVVMADSIVKNDWERFGKYFANENINKKAIGNRHIFYEIRDSFPVPLCHFAHFLGVLTVPNFDITKNFPTKDIDKFIENSEYQILLDEESISWGIPEEFVSDQYRIYTIGSGSSSGYNLRDILRKHNQQRKKQRKRALRQRYGK